MSFVILTDEEQECLRRCDMALWSAYIYLKKQMDSATGVSGEVRKVSYQGLMEWLGCEQHQGKAQRQFTRGQVRYMIDKMECIGLVTRLSKKFSDSIILKHNYGFSHSSVSEKFPRCSREVAAKSRIPLDKKSPEKIGKNENSPEKFPRGSHEDSAKFRIHLEYNNNTYTNKERELEKVVNAENSANKKNNANVKNTPAELSSHVNQIFSHWRNVFECPKATLDRKRLCAIQNALKLGYSVEQCQQAISGCRQSRFHMGANESGVRYNHLSLILRDRDHIERFISYTQSRSLNHAVTASSKHKPASGLDQLAADFEADYEQFHQGRRQNGLSGGRERR